MAQQSCITGLCNERPKLYRYLCHNLASTYRNLSIPAPFISFLFCPAPHENKQRSLQGMDYVQCEMAEWWIVWWEIITWELSERKLRYLYWCFVCTKPLITRVLCTYDIFSLGMTFDLFLHKAFLDLSWKVAASWLKLYVRWDRELIFIYAIY